MEALKRHLPKINLPRESQAIYKDECVFSFDTPESPGGLYVSLTSFYGFGQDYVQKYAAASGNAVFLHIRTNKILKDDKGLQLGEDGNNEKVSSALNKDEAPRKITRLAIGLEGGFNNDTIAPKYEYQHIYTIVVAPDFDNELPYPDTELPTIVVESIEAILDMDSATKQLAKQSVTGTWDGEARKNSEYAHNLVQLDNGVKVPPSGWKCANCDLTNNLWLNLTDGSILCGRRFFDGSGGNNHAVQHYREYGYPLAVKLGTITPDGKSDVYSYPEDDMVIDPYLEQHLQHFGIKMSSMKKSEKSMVELELEANNRIGEWSLLTESESVLEPLYGPGYTGMRNLGNSCYINSVMQVLFHICDFIDRFTGVSAQRYFEQFPNDPANDVNIQMSKLGEGLWSGKYSRRPTDNSTDNENGITPTMFKNVIGKNHPDFSTKQQQDAYDFYLHICNIMEKHSRNQFNPVDALKFIIEERVECQSSKMVKYTQRTEYSMPLEIPLERAINKTEVEEYLARKKLADATAASAAGKDTDATEKVAKFDTETVHPIVPFQACLDRFFAAELIEQFYSTAVKTMTTAKKTTRMVTFPDFLMLHLRKFTLSDDWTPKKIDVCVQMPDEINISDWRAQGLQANEQQLPNTGNANETTAAAAAAAASDDNSSAGAGNNEPKKFTFDECILNELLQMGYPKEACKRAIYHTANCSLEAASNWLMNHIADSDFSDPFIEPAATQHPTAANSSSTAQQKLAEAAIEIDTESLIMLMTMGFEEHQARKALIATGGNIERATDWIFSHADEMDYEDTIEHQRDNSAPNMNEAMNENAAATAASNNHKKFPRDGNGKYKLVAFISHMGTSAQVGHYVCHIRKDDKWVIYNDDKVALSKKPPKDFGYLYLYQRTD